MMTLYDPSTHHHHLDPTSYHCSTQDSPIHPGLQTQNPSPPLDVLVEVLHLISAQHSPAHHPSRRNRQALLGTILAPRSTIKAAGALVAYPQQTVEPVLKGHFQVERREQEQ